MKTRIEVEVPFGKEDALIAGVQDFGGKVVGIRMEPIAAGGINPRRLLRRIRSNGVELKDAQGSLGQEEGISYSRIFASLREFPFDQQREVLESFFGHSMRDSKIGVRLGGFLARVNNTSWLEPQEAPDEEELQGISDDFYQSINRPALPVRVVRDDWQALGKLVIDNFKDGQGVTFSADRSAWLDELDKKARTSLGAHRDYREAYEAQRLVGSILHDIETKGWDARVRELRFWGGEGYTTSDFGKMGAGAALRADTCLAAASMVLGKHLPRMGYQRDVLAEGIFNGVSDRGYVFMGPINGQSVVFVPQVKN